ncbi:hypothetical protein [Brachybacterium alimentarium]|uniref:hypothetical protein n=1 Tax=Brachybacterium alimentarium TaxID=47845 RepID=UPI000DF2356B|nr:hypothetical protein [Brachybacterium alimentarium]RCS81837.1 hypothetical protein CIK67_15685 [Brachybacterium alimentarium]
MTDAFTTAARAEGQSRIAAMLESAGASADIRAWFPAGFEKGAEWARDHLAAQEPTDAEVEAADRGRVEHNIRRKLTDAEWAATRSSIEHESMRAALTAAKEARA